MTEKLTNKVLLDQLRSTSRELFIAAYERKLGDKPHDAFIGKPLAFIALKSVSRGSGLKVSPLERDSLDNNPERDDAYIHEGLDLRTAIVEQGVEVFYQPELSDLSGSFDSRIEQPTRHAIIAAQTLSHETLVTMATTTENSPFIKDWTDSEYRILESMFDEPTSGFMFEFDPDLPLNGYEPDTFLDGYKDFMERKSIIIRNNIEQQMHQGNSELTMELGHKKLAEVRAAIARVDAIIDK